MEHSGLSDRDSMDILLKLYPKAEAGERAMILFRSVGKAFEVSSAPEGDFSNIDVLKKLARTADFSYVLGMNLTRITV